MKRNSKQFLALFMAVAMSVTPVSYAYAEDSAVAGVENTESGQQTVEVTDGKIGAADVAGQPAEEVTGQEEETTAGQGTDENQKSQEEPKAEENAATGNVTEAEKKEAGEDGKSEEKAAEEQKVKSEETAENAGEVKTQEAKNVTSDFAMFKVGSSSVVKENDSVIFFNFRPDRAREITRAFCDDEFKGFERAKKLDLTYVCFTDYDETIQNKLVAFHKVQLKNTFGEYLAAHDMTQVRIAETEKYAHVTFFFNGGVEEPNKGEDRILVKSPKVATYDLQPEMSAPEVCDKLVDAIKSDKYDVIIINFANPDMVGHTGVQAAAVKAIETVDGCVGRAVEALKEVDGQMFICADHGNAEQLIDYETGEPWTAHTTNPVPFILVNADPKYTLKENGCLADIIPTLIQLMGMEQPADMTGESLLVEK